MFFWEGEESRDGTDGRNGNSGTDGVKGSKGESGESGIKGDKRKTGTTNRSPCPSLDICSADVSPGQSSDAQNRRNGGDG